MRIRRFPYNEFRVARFTITILSIDIPCYRRCPFRDKPIILHVLSHRGEGAIRAGHIRHMVDILNFNLHFKRRDLGRGFSGDNMILRRIR